MYATNVGTAWFLFKYSLFKRHTVCYFRELLRNQYLSRDELEYRSWNRTKALLQYAYEKVPYYKKRFDSIGLHPNDIAHPDDYCQVPVLRRKDLQEHFEDLVSVDARRGSLRLVTTGGSTGEPVKVYHEKRVVRAAMGWRMLSWWGLPPDCNWASVYRDTSMNWQSRLLNQVIWWPTRRILLNATSFNESDIKQFIKEFLRVKPPLLHGYVGAICYLADYLLERGIELPIPKAVWVTSAPLTRVQERLIEKAFRAPVYDQYGCCEVYWVAAQCPAKKGLHIFHDIRRIDFLDEQNMCCPPGNLGKIAITDLENYVFPLIRYLNGDVGRALPGNCTCGVSLPLMDQVRGRISDTLKLPNGLCISGEYLTTIFDDHPDAVKQFQVHQRVDYSVTICVVPNNECRDLEQILIKVRDNLRKEVNNQISVEIQKTSNIHHERGKLRFVKSDVG